ncbi:GNAT family N-acetyltransferase [Bacillus cereus group sp. BfR-BA-01380]|uniref:GNAT family N-acetyltransferase n=1 Tax=Bacillus cereus group sp. BfR-BA-01380 TaxID=2920324 RepID=UPI001F581A43|nr:GNAT family N-acetyltransferase [Bacillus cereus group sp. BfR-BA-01380]
MIVIRLHIYTNFTQFKNDVLPFLETYEQENNLILGVLRSSQLPLFMATAVKEEELVFVMLQTHHRQVIVAKSVPLEKDDMRELAQQLAIAYPDVPGLIGEKQVVERLAEQLAGFQNKSIQIKMNQGVYGLKYVKKKAGSNGVFRRVELQEKVLIEDWVYHFCEEVNLAITKEEVVHTAAELIESQRLFGWEVEGQIVSMAAVTRPTKRNITINFVYTPEKERKKGYAFNCVSALSQYMLDSGYETTSLYTDLANPTSNKIYQEIGYEQIMESVLLFLESK